jgi:hypothetical protein
MLIGRSICLCPHCKANALMMMYFYDVDEEYIKDIIRGIRRTPGFKSMEATKTMTTWYRR